MPQTPAPSGPPSTAILRAAAAVVLLLGLGATGLLSMPVLRGDPAGPQMYAPAVVALMVGVGLAAGLEGVARLIGHLPTASNPATDAGPAVAQLAATVAELRSALPEMLAGSKPPPAAHAGPAVFDDADAQPEPVAVDAATSHLERVVQLLEEMKELALLDDAQRQARGQMSKDRRKLERVDEAAGLIARHEWEQADALLTLLESLHPGDPDVLARRNELDDLRTGVREAEWAQLVRHVEDLLALGRYDEAGDAVATFRESYPTHVDAAGLSVQIRSDHEAYVERTAAALFNEIKTAVDARQWRMALDGTQRFLSRFPDNVRSDRIRQQVRTIQKNAEIEERHENEARIKDLARSGRFAEAADLCQELLARFPTSPQAPSLQNLLPRLRERSAMVEAAVE